MVVGMKKKLAFTLLFLACILLPAFSFDIAAFAQSKYKLMDIPLILGMDYFWRAMGDFYYYARTLSVLLAFVTVFWTSFRLWAGTVEIRNALVDIFLKFFLFFALFSLYPSITNFVINKAVTIGMRAGDGYNTLNAKFNAFAVEMERKVALGHQQLEAMMSGNFRMTPELARKISERAYISEADQQAFLQRVSGGGNIISYEEMAPAITASAAGVTTAQGLPIAGTNLFNVLNVFRSKGVVTSVDDFNRAMDAALRQSGSNLTAAEFADAIVILRAMQEIFIQADENGRPVNDSSVVRKYMLSPYLLDAQGSQTNMLSPSALIKLSVLISSVITARLDNFYDEENGFVSARPLFGIVPTLSDVQRMFLTVLMTLAVILSVVFFCIQYVMCIFEYYITTSVGALFIPFILFDGTKSFTAKLVTLFSAYFIKLLVMCLCVFWVLNVFIDVNTTIMFDKNPVSMLNVGYFLFTTILCWVVTLYGPSVAVTILNGNPQLSMGEFVHAVGVAAGGALLARRAVHTAGAVAGGAVHAGQAGVRTAQAAAARWQGAGNAVRESGLTGFRAFGAQASTFGRLTTDNLVQRMGEFATGKQSNLNDGNTGKGPSRVGGGSGYSHNKDGTQNFAEGKKNAELQAGKHLGNYNAPEQEKPKKEDYTPDGARQPEDPKS
jgi:type IV secretion system protein TrbL